MKTFRPPLESNGRNCRFLKLALQALEKGDKSSFLMSGHVDTVEVKHTRELAQHWEELGKARTGGSGVELGDSELESREDISDLCQEVGWQEVVGVLKQLKREKAPGPDGVLNKMLIYAWRD